jgi:hypothetical protein
MSWDSGSGEKFTPLRKRGIVSNQALSRIIIAMAT